MTSRLTESPVEAGFKYPNGLPRSLVPALCACVCGGATKKTRELSVGKCAPSAKDRHSTSTHCLSYCCLRHASVPSLLLCLSPSLFYLLQWHLSSTCALSFSLSTLCTSLFLSLTCIASLSPSLSLSLSDTAHIYTHTHTFWACSMASRGLSSSWPGSTL